MKSNYTSDGSGDDTFLRSTFESTKVNNVYDWVIDLGGESVMREIRVHVETAPNTLHKA